jgi:patatin-like phospholipase/acyl hydrolase
LDGGGYRGMFTAQVLAVWEEKLQRRIADCFDLIVGTSTGGIVALGLAAGLPASELVKFYKEDGRDLFPARHSLWRYLAGGRHWFWRKYNPDALERALQARLPKVTLGDLKKPVVIPSFNLEDGKHWYFKTPHFKDNAVDASRPIWEVARATSAAPSYFPAFRSSKSELFIDGGMVANNPSLVGYFEVQLNFPQWAKNIKILNLGTEGGECSLPSRRLSQGGLLAWAKKAPDVLMQAQAVSTEKLMERLLGTENWLRVKPQHGRDFAPLDFYEPQLYQGLAVSEAARAYHDAEQRFFTHQARSGLVAAPVSTIL